MGLKHRKEQENAKKTLSELAAIFRRRAAFSNSSKANHWFMAARTTVTDLVDEGAASVDDAEQETQGLPNKSS